MYSGESSDDVPINLDSEYRLSDLIRMADGGHPEARFLLKVVESFGGNLGQCVSRDGVLHRPPRKPEVHQLEFIDELVSPVDLQ